MARLNALFTLILCLVVTTTSLGMAFARAQAPAEGQVTLCTAHGMVMVFTDGDGQPTSPPQLCSDGLMALFAALPAVVPDLVQPDMARSTLGQRHADLWQDGPTLIRPARGPPTA